MSVEVSHDNVVIMEFRNKVEVWREIGRTGIDRWNVNIMNVDGNILDDGCNGEMLGDGVIGEEGVGREVTEW